jgi:hypothetical protein
MFVNTYYQSWWKIGKFEFARRAKKIEEAFQKNEYLTCSFYFCVMR